MIDFEKAFSDFLDRKEYDEASNALFSIVRSAFFAGWLAGGGTPLKTQMPIKIIYTDKHTNKTKPHTDF